MHPKALSCAAAGLGHPQALRVAEQRLRVVPQVMMLVFQLFSAAGKGVWLVVELF
jgi:hypothetical protein